MTISQIRTTFGIVDPETQEQYKDIIEAKLVRLLIAEEDIMWGNCSLKYNNRTYWLQCDSRLRDYIKKKHSAVAVVSIQHRTDINIAVARLQIADWEIFKQEVDKNIVYVGHESQLPPIKD